MTLAPFTEKEFVSIAKRCAVSPRALERLLGSTRVAAIAPDMGQRAPALLSGPNLRASWGLYRARERRAQTEIRRGEAG